MTDRVWSITFLPDQDKVLVMGQPPEHVLDSLAGIPNLYFTDTDTTWTTNNEEEFDD